MLRTESFSLLVFCIRGGKSNMVIDMTTGSPIKRIMKFILPVILGNLLQQFYSMADSIIVSRFIGVKAFAGVTATGSLNFLILGFTWGLCSGCAIPMAQEFGAKDFSKMRRCFANAFYLTGAASVVLAVVTTIFTPAILRLVGTPEDIFEFSRVYISIMFIGMPATVLYNLLANAMRSVGDGRTPLIMLIVSSLLNIGLDLLFVITFNMGIAGAAIATVISQLVSGVLCLFVIFFRFDILKVRREEWTLSFPIIGRLTRIGIPMGLQFSITAIGSIIMQSSVNSLGSDAVASIGAGAKVQFVFTTAIEALGTTMATYCGQNLGARRMDRVRKGVWQITCIMVLYSVIAYLLQLLVGRWLVELFLGETEEVILENTMYYLKFVLTFVFFLALVMIYRNSIQGLGYSKAAMFAGIMELIARSFVALTIVPRFGYKGACIGNPLAWIFADILLVPMFLVVVKKLERVYGKNAPAETNA